MKTFAAISIAAALPAVTAYAPNPAIGLAAKGTYSTIESMNNKYRALWCTFDSRMLFIVLKSFYSAGHTTHLGAIE